MSGLREQIEALRDECGAEHVRNGPNLYREGVLDGKIQALRDVLALLDQQPPKRWSAEVEYTDEDGGARRTVVLLDGERWCELWWTTEEVARSLAAQINGEA